MNDIAASVPSSATFDQVADITLPEEARLDAFSEVTETLGRVYEPAGCLTSCGFAWACRRCVFAAGDPSIAGGPVARTLPGIASLERVAQLGRGAPPSLAEAPAAGPVARAGRLYDEAMPARRSAERRPA